MGEIRKLPRYKGHILVRTLAGIEIDRILTAHRLDYIPSLERELLEAMHKIQKQSLKISAAVRKSRRLK